MILGSITFSAGWFNNEEPVVQAGGAIVVAGLVLLGAAVGLSTWQEERKKAREQQQREAYATLVLQLLSRFGAAGDWDPKTEARVRTQVVVWAEAPVIEKLSAWHAVYDLHVPDVAPGQRVSLTCEAKAAFEKATVEVVQAVRTQLSPDDNVTVGQLTQVLFNKPTHPG